MNSLIAPKSIAVIGASRNPEAVGHACFRNLLMGGYNGILYPVNPKAKSILSVRTYASVKEIPDSVDMAVIVVPRDSAISSLEECGTLGVKAAIVISAGFKEVGPEGAAAEMKLRQIAEKYGIALMGPNCLGMINTDPDVTMNASFSQRMPRAGNIGFVSQSGALCTAVLDYANAADIGFSKFVSLGNKAYVDENDLLEFLRDDPQTNVIVMYLESLVDGRRFIQLANEITGGKNRKPILALKSGRTAQGAKAASSHTGSLAGTDEVYDAIFAQAGVLRVDTVDEMFDYAQVFSTQPIPKGNRVCIVTNAGGPGIMATDAAIRHGLELAALQPETVEALRKTLPSTANVHNPVDVIGDAKLDRYETAIGKVINDANVDGVIVILTPQAMSDAEGTANVVVKAAKGITKPLITSFMGVSDVSKGTEILRRNHIPNFKFPESASRAFAELVKYEQWLDRPSTQVKVFEARKADAQKILAAVIQEKRSHLPERDTAPILAAYGLPVPQSFTATSADEAVLFADRIGYPVVAKISSPHIIHKFDVGGVALNLKDAASVRNAFENIMKSVKEKEPKALIWGIGIQPMAKPGGVETILGVKRDPQFGPMLMFGLGGTFVEIFKDVIFRVAPVDELSARQMVEKIKSAKLLKGYRGQPPMDIDALVDSIQRLSQLVLDLPEIEELDINPLRVFPKGQGCTVLDCRILLKDENGHGAAH